MLVHVIKPNGTRFEFGFADTDTPAKILKALEGQRPLFGRGRVVQGDDPALGTKTWLEDPTAPWAFDDPATVVVIGEAKDKEFIEIKRIKGPPKEADPG